MGKILGVGFIFCLLCSPWVINAWKLSDCDFEGNLKCEFIHGVGLVIPPASYITVWFDDDVTAPQGTE